MVSSICFSKNKTIDFGKNFSVEQVEETSEYISVRIYNQFNQRHSAFLYDRSGNEINKRNEFNGNCLFCGISDKYKLWIIIIEGAPSNLDTPEIKDKIYAYNLQNGQLVWESKATAETYVISPDGSYLATESTAFERSSPLTVINLQDGSDCSLSIKSYLKVAWYDDKKLLVIQAQLTKDDPERIDKWKHVNKLRSEALKNNVELKEGKTTEEVFVEKQKAIQAEINQYINEINNAGVGRKQTVSRLLIIDVPSNYMEYNNELYLQDGTQFIMGDNGNNLIGVDSNKNIYLYGFTNVNLKRKGLMIKLDDNRKILWKYSVDNYEYTQIKMISCENDVDFTEWNFNTKQYGIMEKDTGKLIPLDEFEQKSNKVFVKNRNVLKHGRNSLKEFKDIEISENDTKITFKR